MSTKALIVCVALAFCARHSQARSLLNATSPPTCADVTPAPTCGSGFNWTGTAPVTNASAADAVLFSQCCLALDTASNCTHAAVCGTDKLIILGQEGAAVTQNTTFGNARTLCCEAKFEAPHTCANETEVECAAGKHWKSDVSLVNLTQSRVPGACCVANPACDADDCAAPWAVANTSVVPASNLAALRTAECCVLPENATCSNWAAAANATEAAVFNCSEIAEFPAKANSADVSISKANLAEATAACCDAVYKVTDTCASISFNCTAEGYLVDDTNAADNVTLEGVFKVPEAVAAECCASKPVVTTTDTTTPGKKNSAGAKAVSFGVSAVALLAMLLL